MNDHLASLLEYDANPQLHRMATDDVDVRCDRDWWRRERRKLEESEDVDASTSTIQEILMEMPAKNSLQGTVDPNFEAVEDDKGENHSSQSSLPSNCQSTKHQTLFTLEADRDEWQRLCQDLPHDTLMADRLDLLAQSNCDRRGNPRTDEPEFIDRMTRMNMKGARPEAYACHHIPQRQR